MAAPASPAKLAAAFAARSSPPHRCPLPLARLGVAVIAILANCLSVLAIAERGTDQSPRCSWRSASRPLAVGEQ